LENRLATVTPVHQMVNGIRIFDSESWRLTRRNRQAPEKVNVNSTIAGTDPGLAVRACNHARLMIYDGTLRYAAEVDHDEVSVAKHELKAMIMRSEKTILKYRR